MSIVLLFFMPRSPFDFARGAVSRAVIEAAAAFLYLKQRRQKVLSTRNRPDASRTVLISCCAFIARCSKYFRKAQKSGRLKKPAATAVSAHSESPFTRDCISLLEETLRAFCTISSCCAAERFAKAFMASVFCASAKPNPSGSSVLSILNTPVVFYYFLAESKNYSKKRALSGSKAFYLKSLCFSGAIFLLPASAGNSFSPPGRCAHKLWIQ